MKFILAFLLVLITSFAHAAGLQLPNGEQQFFDTNGNPLAGGLVYTYVPNTTTPKNTWQDPNLVALNTNPIVLDSGGRARIWAAGSAQFRQVVHDADGNLIWDQPAYVPGMGTGTVTGPATTTVNEVASWNNTTGTLLRQGPARITNSKSTPITTSGSAFEGLSVAGASATGIVDEICDGCSYTTYDAVRGVSVVPDGTTVSNTNGIAGYVQNRAAGANARALFGAGTCEVSNCRTWGATTLLMDSGTYTIGADTTREVYGYEASFNIVNPGSTVIGVELRGDSLVQPTNATGFKIAPIGTGFHWITGFSTDNGAASWGASLGAAAATGNNINSQLFDLRYLDSAGVQQSVRQDVVAGAPPQWRVGSTVPSGIVLSLTGTSGFWLDGHPSMSADGSDNLLIGPGPGIAGIFIGNSTAPITISSGAAETEITSSLLTIPNITTVAAGTGKYFLCIDPATSVIFKGTGVSCN